MLLIKYKYLSTLVVVCDVASVFVVSKKYVFWQKVYSHYKCDRTSLEFCWNFVWNFDYKHFSVILSATFISAPMEFCQNLNESVCRVLTLICIQLKVFAQKSRRIAFTRAARPPLVHRLLSTFQALKL